MSAQEAPLSTLVSRYTRHYIYIYGDWRGLFTMRKGLNNGISFMGEGVGNSKNQNMQCLAVEQM